MPSSAISLLKDAGLKPGGPVPWGQRLETTRRGVYLVCLTASPGAEGRQIRHPPIELTKIETWIERVPRIRIDGQPCTAEQLRERLAKFWLPDEAIFYIGKATLLRSRITAFYNTPLGDRGPHAGGHWIKTLSELDQALVYYAESNRPEEAECRLLRAFMKNVSKSSQARVYDS